MKLRTLIADDEPLARERLKQLLAQDAEIEIAGESRNGNEVVAMLKGTQIDLLFLDIQMPGSSGFDVIESVGLRNMPLTVFVTAHSEFAVEAFAVHALHYLVKPVERRHLEEAVSRVKERVRLQETFAARREIYSVLEALQGPARPSYPERLLAKNGNKDSVVSVREIEWIEAADYYVCLHAGGKKHLLRESIKALSAKLDPGKFVRLHRSAIVNIEHVREIHRDGRAEGWVLLTTGERVRMNRTGWQKLIDLNSL
ncbi:MAG: LytTR family DNA-binding domain-containing protein [Candidatus Sulfotelmatobacter sp.]